MRPHLTVVTNFPFRGRSPEPGERAKATNVNAIPMSRSPCLHSQVSHTKYHSLGGLNNEIYFLTVLVAMVQDQGFNRVGFP